MAVSTFSAPLDTNGELYYLGQHSRAEHSLFRETFSPPQVPMSEYTLIDPASTAYGLMDVYGKGGILLAENVSFAPCGVLHVPGADYGIPVALTRAGILYTTSSSNPLSAVTIVPRSVEQGLLYKGGVFPITRDATVTELYYHPLSAPSSVAPLVCGLSGEVVMATMRSAGAFTASHWLDVLLVGFEVADGAPAHIQVIARIASATSITPYSSYLHTHQRLGILAVPSATNPDAGATPPSTMFSFLMGVTRPYRRAWDIGYSSATTFGASATLS